MSKNKRNPIKFSEGGMWEGRDWEIRFNEPCDKENACRHCGKGYSETHKSYDGDYFSCRKTKCPRVIVAWNEGGYNTTGVCLDCILEAAEVVFNEDKPK